MTVPKSESDERLLERLQGDPMAFEDFYRRHIHKITGFAVRRCSGPEEVADLVAAVFLAVVESAHRYDALRGDAVAWLFAIAANELRAQRRRSWRQRRITLRLSGQRLLDVDDYGRIIDMIDDARLSGDLRRAVARLPAGERAVFELITLDGLTATQAAAALGITPTASRVRLSRAKGRLRAALGDLVDASTGESPIPGQPATRPADTFKEKLA